MSLLISQLVAIGLAIPKVGLFDKALSFSLFTFRICLRYGLGSGDWPWFSQLRSIG
jgi:hypothetical protein